MSPVSTTIGAIPGAMPPLIGYAAASGRLNFEAGILYAILFLWQFPHFYAIAWMYREDYARAGIRMLPVVEPDGDSTGRRIVLILAGAGSHEPRAGVFLHGRQRVSLRRAGFGRAGFSRPVSARPRNIPFCALARCCWRAWFIFLCCMGSWSSTAAVFSLALLGAGCGPAGRCRMLPRMRALPSYASVPEFSLTDQTGAKFDSGSALNGHVWVADFMFTTCPGPCPRMSKQMSEVQAALQGTDARMVSLTVDPQHDTPPVLAKYAAFYPRVPACGSS